MIWIWLDRDTQKIDDCDWIMIDCQSHQMFEQQLITQPCGSSCRCWGSAGRNRRLCAADSGAEAAAAGCGSGAGWGWRSPVSCRRAGGCWGWWGGGCWVPGTGSGRRRLPGSCRVRSRERRRRRLACRRGIWPRIRGLVRHACH